MSTDKAPLLQQASPTGAPIIPAKYVPYVQAAASVLLLLGAELGLEGPWTAERYFMVGAAILSMLLGGSLPGLRR